MEKLKNLCGQIPEELHNKVRTEQESLGLTLGKYLEQVLTAHFAAPAPAVRGGDRTLAFQVPEVLFQRVKQYLEAHKPLSQKAFVVGLLENALIKWERGEEISSGMNTIGKGEKERTLAVVVPCELFERVKGCLAAHGSMSQRDFVLGLIEQEVSGWENQQAVEQDAVIPQEETDEALSNVGVVQQISEDEPLTEDLEGGVLWLLYGYDVIGGGVSLYIYPDNLKSKATLWLWELRDIGIVGIGCLISVFALAQLGFILPIVFTAAYAFLSIRIEDTSILDFIRYALQFFVLRQQTYDWGMRIEAR